MSQPSDSMEDILTSIRTSVEEETAKAGGGDDVLALSPDDIVDDKNGKAVNGHAAAPVDELIDINAFAASGEQVGVGTVDVGADVLGENAPLPEAAPAAAAPAAAAPVTEAKAAEDEFDRLLAELEAPAAPPSVTPAPAPAAAPAPKPEVAPAPVAAPVAAPQPAPVAAPVAPAAPTPVQALAEGRLELGAIAGPDGLQLALPAEVLAAALRPLVKDWVAENLAGVVERLVKDEIAKLTQE